MSFDGLRFRTVVKVTPIHRTVQSWSADSVSIDAYGPQRLNLQLTNSLPHTMNLSSPEDEYPYLVKLYELLHENPKGEFLETGEGLIFDAEQLWYVDVEARTIGWVWGCDLPRHPAWDLVVNFTRLHELGIQAKQVRQRVMYGLRPKGP